MLSFNHLLAILIVIGILNSCTISRDLKPIYVEVLKPTSINFPKNIRSAAIFNRDLYQMNKTDFKCFKETKDTKIPDIKYQELSNHCVDVLTEFLLDQGYFEKVTNYRDSLNFQPIPLKDKFNSAEYFELSKADVCLFLNQYSYDTTRLNYDKDVFIIEPNLQWSIVFNDSDTEHLFNQKIKLKYLKSEFPQFFKHGLSLHSIIDWSASDLAVEFGKSIVPYWEIVERMYYKSGNIKMREAEKCAFANDWLKAAEIWNKETKSKNQDMAAKACYNMALACEMQGKNDLAVDWLNKSMDMIKLKSEPNSEWLKLKIELHRTNCLLYIRALKERNMNIEKLEEQISNVERN